MSLFFEAKYNNHLKAWVPLSAQIPPPKKGCEITAAIGAKFPTVSLFKNLASSLFVKYMKKNKSYNPAYTSVTSMHNKNVFGNSSSIGFNPLYYLTIAVLIFIPALSSAQAVKVSTAVEDTIYLIGQHIPLNINLERTTDVTVPWPFLVDSLGSFEIIKSGKIDTTQAGEKYIEQQQLILTKFDTGYYVIPPIEFEYKENRRTQIAKTEPIIIRMNTMEVDTTAAIMPIKNVIKMPLTFKEKLQRALLIAGIVLLVFGIPLLLYFYFKRRKKEAYLPPPLPPYELAIQRLNEVQTKKLWQEGKVKQYYIELTEVLREYIGGRFEINALELTTDEIAPLLKKKKEVTKGLFRNAVDLLTIADYVKFAKAQPSTKYHTDSLEQVKQFLKATKPVEEIEKVETKA